MFGESAVVYCFLRFSRAIAALSSFFFGLTVTEFFDDFTQVGPKSTEQTAQDSIEFLIEELGWKLSKGEEKRKDFDTNSKALVCPR